VEFPRPVPISFLSTIAASKVEWIWEGYIAERGITLFTALWKSGKTTLLAWMLRAMGEGKAMFCGQPLRACKVLIVTQEHPTLWNRRREELGLTDDVVFFQLGPDNHPTPFKGKPSRAEW
jgi:hypothetical protein